MILIVIVPFNIIVSYPGSNCPQVRIGNPQSCYYVGQTLMTYNDARDACKDMDGTLTSVLNQAVQTVMIRKSDILFNNVTDVMENISKILDVKFHVPNFTD